MTLSAEATNFTWLINEFVDRVPGVAHVIVVSSDGLLLVMSDGLPRERADQLSAIASGLVSLTGGAARCFDAGEVRQTIVEMDQGFLIVMAISDESRWLSSRRAVVTSAWWVTRWRCWCRGPGICSLLT